MGPDFPAPVLRSLQQSQEGSPKTLLSQEHSLLAYSSLSAGGIPELRPPRAPCCTQEPQTTGANRLLPNPPTSHVLLGQGPANTLHPSNCAASNGASLPKPRMEGKPQGETSSLVLPTAPSREDRAAVRGGRPVPSLAVPNCPHKGWLHGSSSAVPSVDEDHSRSYLLGTGFVLSTADISLQLSRDGWEARGVGVRSVCQDCDKV